MLQKRVGHDFTHLNKSSVGNLRLQSKNNGHIYNYRKGDSYYRFQSKEVIHGVSWFMLKMFEDLSFQAFHYGTLSLRNGVLFVLAWVTWVAC